MKFGDFTKAVLIVLIFGLLFFSTILTSGLQKIKDDWPQYRCVPTYMPLAGYLGHNTMTNFSYCVGNIQKDMMGFFLEPITYVLGNVGTIVNGVLENIQFIREFFDKFKNMIGSVLGDVYGMIVNVLIQFQKLIIKTKDTMMKLIGTMVTFIYLIQSAMKTGQSIVTMVQSVKHLREICFSKNTPIKLKNGKIVKIKDIHLGDILENNSEVYGTLKLKGNEANPYYQLWSRTLERYIYVTGDHKILTNNQKNRAKLNNYIEVKDYRRS